MVFKTIISFICGLYRFYPVLPISKTDCFTQFYPILPNWFYPLGKTTMPTLNKGAYVTLTLAIAHYTGMRKMRTCGIADRLTTARTV